MKFFNKALLASLFLLSGSSVFAVNNEKKESEQKSVDFKKKNNSSLCDSVKNVLLHEYTRLAVLGCLGAYGLYKGYQNRDVVQEIGCKGLGAVKSFSNNLYSGTKEFISGAYNNPQQTVSSMYTSTKNAAVSGYNKVGLWLSSLASYFTSTSESASVPKNIEKACCKLCKLCKSE